MEHCSRRSNVDQALWGEECAVSIKRQDKSCTPVPNDRTYDGLSKHQAPKSNMRLETMRLAKTQSQRYKCCSGKSELSEWEELLGKKRGGSIFRGLGKALGCLCVGKDDESEGCEGVKGVNGC